MYHQSILYPIILPPPQKEVTVDKATVDGRDRTFILVEQWAMEDRSNSGISQDIVCAHEYVYLHGLSQVRFKAIHTGTLLCRDKISSAVLRLRAKKFRMSVPICTILCKSVCVCDINGTPIAVVPWTSIHCKLKARADTIRRPLHWWRLRKWRRVAKIGTYFEVKSTGLPGV